MPPGPPLPSLSILLNEVASKREAMKDHAESLDTKAGVILGFTGLLVGLGATTAQSAIFKNLVFQVGLGFAVAAAAFAASAFVPRSYPTLQMHQLRSYLTADEPETQLTLLDTQIEMVGKIANLLKRKGRRVALSIGCLAIAAALIVAGTLIEAGATDKTAAKPSVPGPVNGVDSTGVTQDSITVAWNRVTGAIGYQVRVTYQDKLVNQQSVFGTSSTIFGLGADHTYGIHVAEVNAAGMGPEGDVDIKTSKP